MIIRRKKNMIRKIWNAVLGRRKVLEERLSLEEALKVLHDSQTTHSGKERGSCIVKTRAHFKNNLYWQERTDKFREMFEVIMHMKSKWYRGGGGMHEVYKGENTERHYLILPHGRELAFNPRFIIQRGKYADAGKVVWDIFYCESLSL